MSQEILIIGGGIIGLSIARELNERGVKRITIAERGVIGGEASWAAAGMLAPNIEAPAQNEFHRFCIDALELYPAFAAALLDETGIDIELDRSGTLCIGFGDADEAALDENAARGFRRLSATEVRDLEPAVTQHVSGGILFPDDWQVENRKLLSALRSSVEGRGVRILEGIEVRGLVTEGSRVTGAKTDRGDMHADVTVLATGAWTSLIKIGDAKFPIAVKPVRGQMVSFDARERKIGRVVFSPRGYLVPRADGRVLVGATVEDVGFDKTTTDEGFDSLKAAALEMAPVLARSEITEHWAGLRPYSVDGFPILGELSGHENGFVATAHYRNGILLAPKTAQILAARIVDGVESAYLRTFGMDRVENKKSVSTR